MILKWDSLISITMKTMLVHKRLKKVVMMKIVLIKQEDLLMFWNVK
jgi:hypothetical protein